MPTTFYYRNRRRISPSSLPSEESLPRGFQVFDPDSYFDRQESQNSQMDVIQPIIEAGCGHGDLDRCQRRCGACISAGGFEKLPKYLIRVI